MTSRGFFVLVGVGMAWSSATLSCSSDDEDGASTQSASSATSSSSGTGAEGGGSSSSGSGGSGNEGGRAEGGAAPGGAGSGGVSKGGAGQGGGTGNPKEICDALETTNMACWNPQVEQACVMCFGQCGNSCLIQETCPLTFACP